MTAEPTHEDASISLQPKASTETEGAGEISVSSSGTQKRFSFYNAQDYQVKTQQQEPSNTSSSNPNRYNFYNADEMAHKEHMEQQQQQQQQSSFKENSTHHKTQQSNSGSSSDLDSTQILRSLQEHEQQRLEILGGSSSSTVSAAGLVSATANSLAVEVKAPANQHQRQQQQPRRASYTSTNNYNNNSSSNVNPYEDAIKEALELLRRHRSAPASTLSAPNTPHQFSRHASLPSPLASDVGAVAGGQNTATTTTARRYPTTGAKQTFMQQQQHEALHSLVRATATTREYSPPDEILKARASWEAPPSSSAQQQTTLSSIVHHSMNSQQPNATPSEDGTTTTGVSSVVLGEAYQAEIEARRKQRQERMARYASRLAELKQDTISPTGSAAALSSSTKTILTTKQAAATGPSPWGSNTTHSHTSGASSSHNSSSSLPRQQHQQQTPVKTVEEDEANVQRGVERVLLAILERATSRGRLSQQRNQQKGGGIHEEKKSADLTLLNSHSQLSSNVSSEEDFGPAFNDNHMNNNNNNNIISGDDDALLRAMSELLQQSSSMQTGSMNDDNDSDGLFADENDNLDDVERRIAIAVHHHHQKTQQQDPIVAGDAETTVTQDSQTMAIRPVGSDPEAHQELDRMVEHIFNEPAEDILDGILDSNEDDEIRDSDERQAMQGTTEEEDQAVEVVVEPTRGVAKEMSSGEGTDGSELFSQQDEESEDEFSADVEEDDLLDEGETGDESYEDESLEEGETGDESYDDDDDDDDDGSENDSRHRKLGVLGPLSMMAGGTTRVVLEGSSSGDSEKQPSIFEAALNLVTGGDTSNRPKDKYAEPDESDNDSKSDSSSSSDSEDSQGSLQELTRTLCAHLFPRGHGDRDELQQRIPKWDESNADEPGYRIIRLNSHQLDTVEREFEHAMKAWKKNSSNDESFERDLKEAEDLLEQEEHRAKASVPDTEPTSNGRASPTGGPSDMQCLEHFPGVKPAGRGEMGDLEYFHLPIIFKSHVTGFEPTKDIHLEPGNIIAGQYLVEGELGSAAFSTAYRCIDLNSEGGDGPDGHDEVCLKIIKNTKDFFDQSLDEIKILELLRQTGKCHENHILEMKTFFYHREHLMIVTELLRQNLFEFGKFIIDNDEEPYFTISRLSYVTRQVLIAMKFVHNIGLVHSDVKPENILLSSYSRAQVKLIDFGSSCYLTDRQSSYIQSRSYRAPEVVLGLPYDGRIDIWSLGCVVAEMYTGEVTFQNDSVVSMLSRIEAICGKFPDHMIEQGRQSAAFFTQYGLLFEKVSRKNDDSYHDDSSEEEKNQRGRSSYDIFQPKRTTLAARLGFNADLLEKYDTNQRLSQEQKRQAVFVDFVRKLLTIDPEKRPSAEEALKHPWMESAATLSEEDIKYPPG